MSSSSSTSTCYWVSKNAFDDKNNNDNNITAVCIGTGRFLRSVLVPLLDEPNKKNVVLIQTRGRSFIDYYNHSKKDGDNNTYYPVDTVMENGNIQTNQYPLAGVFSFGYDKTSIQEILLPKLSNIQILGVGVTEQGLANYDTTIMKDLYEFLTQLQQTRGDKQQPQQKKICIINTDNVPNNGDVLKSHMLQWARDNNKDMTEFLTHKICFLNTMVDRITSHRENDTLVPRAEPIPAKALVISDPEHNLPHWFTVNNRSAGHPGGLVIRQTQTELNVDIQLKLRVANGTHTAIAHLLALCSMLQTDVLASSQNSIMMDYLDMWVSTQVIPAACHGLDLSTNDDASNVVESVWNDWRRRLIHAHFGLSSFFITQNGAAKSGIRWGPTVIDPVQQQQQKANKESLNVTTAFAYAVLLRWLTPAIIGSGNKQEDVYTGWLNGASRQTVINKKELEGSEEYADGLRYNIKAGWYEFKCACDVALLVGDSDVVEQKQSVSSWLSSSCADMPQQPAAYVPVIRAYLLAPDGGNLQAIGSTESFSVLVQAIATLYARMVAGDDLLELLKEIQTKGHGFSSATQELVDAGNIRHGRPLHYRASPVPDTSKLMQAAVSVETAASVVTSEVASAQVIDLHTHLLPPSHGPLCLWGIDELLTYHYLVAEYFMTAPAEMTPEKFYSMTKQKQADLIWKALFIDRTPLSEASRGVVTTMVALGLEQELEARDLTAIRRFYSSFREDGLAGAERFSALVHEQSGVRYNIMTNIPFDPNEVQHWRPRPKSYPEHYRSALRVDPFLSGDRDAVEAALKASGYETTLEGARQFLRDWCDTIKPEYMMASTPHNFMVKEEDMLLKKKRAIGINEDAMKEPGAFADAISGSPDGCDGAEEDMASVINEQSDLLSDVLMKVCEERDLPIALKIGAHRGVNPRLRAAGDGVVAFADAGMLGRLLARFPKVRFLTTFLSRNNQHEACVLANKFGNLHIYGCWWYCFTPSIVREITQMRLEMLGTAFTAQHSDARVLDQLIYKWSHSRAVIAEVLIAEVEKLCASGWKPTREEIRRDIGRIFGRSYEEFMLKSSK